MRRTAVPTRERNGYLLTMDLSFPLILPGGGDYVKSVWFLGEETSTQEGIHIGSTIEEMQEAYGDDYVEEKGRYVYTSQDAVLTFYTKKGLVSGVEYKAIGE